MAARSIASGTISFGLVSIPVRLFSATQAQAAISFNLLHAKCGGRLKQQYICPRDENEIKAVVLLSADELETTVHTRMRAADIGGFQYRVLLQEAAESAAAGAETSRREALTALQLHDWR